MINAVSGKFLYARGSKVVISTSLGIEFEIIVSAFTLSSLMNMTVPQKNNVRLLTAFVFSQDSKNALKNILLYGFQTDEERELFYELNKVNGVGTKNAMKILSNVNVEEFRSYLADDNIKALSKIPGIGSKTASAIILAIKNKLVKPSEEKKISKSRKSHISPEFADMVKSFVDMGYGKDVVEDTILEFEKKIKNSNEILSEEQKFNQIYDILTGNG